MAVAMLLLAVLGAEAQATPVEPDINKLLAQPHTPPQPFPVARAGWKGPETAPSPQAAPHPILENFGAMAQKREMERALRAVAIPDPRAAVAVLIVILVLRTVRRKRLDKSAQPQPGASEDQPQPMAA